MKKLVYVLLVAVLLAGCSSPAKKGSEKIIPEKKIFGPHNNYKTLEDALKSGLPVVAEMVQKNDEPSRMMGIILKQVEEENPGTVVMIQVDVVKRPDLVRMFTIRYLPTMLFYDSNGVYRFRHDGFMTKQRIVDYINKK